LAGEVVKALVLGEKAKTEELCGFKLFFKRSLPLHPVFAGAFLGLSLDATIPDVIATGGTVSSVLYFALSGAFSGTVYSMLKSLKPDLTRMVRRKVASIAKKGSDE
jgi:hypothetical protein